MADKPVIGCGRCPLKLRGFPNSPCPLGLKSIQMARSGKPDSELPCPWFINDASASYCYFKFEAQQSGGDPLTDAKIAQLLLLSDRDIKKIIADFRKKSEELRDELAD